jgi:hypothetical protein
MRAVICGCWHLSEERGSSLSRGISARSANTSARWSEPACRRRKPKKCSGFGPKGAGTQMAIGGARSNIVGTYFFTVATETDLGSPEVEGSTHSKRERSTLPVTLPPLPRNGQSRNWKVHQPRRVPQPHDSPSPLRFAYPLPDPPPNPRPFRGSKYPSRFTALGALSCDTPIS